MENNKQAKLDGCHSNSYQVKEYIALT